MTWSTQRESGYWSVVAHDASTTLILLNLFLVDKRDDKFIINSYI